jgi:hypothetical protein
MAISLPDQYLKKIPKRTLKLKKVPVKKTVQEEETEINEPTVTKETNTKIAEATTINESKKGNDNVNTKENSSLVDDVRKRGEHIEKRLVSAIKFLHDRGQFNIVLMGNGTGAIRTHTFIKSITPQINDAQLKKKLEKPIRASIIFNARNRLPTDNEDYQEWFFDPDIPILDIYTAGDTRNQEDAKIRKALGKNKKAVVHSQIKLTEMSYETSWGENRLSRRIRSFLDAYVQGIEVGNRSHKKEEK